MPPLKNVKHEKFAQGIFQGKSASEAYKAAGYRCTQRAAETSSSDLLKKPEISARVEELSERLAKKVVLTKEWLIDEMIDTVIEAKSDRQHGAATRAMELLGREKGAFVEQKRIAIRSFSDMSVEEIEDFLAGTSGTPAKAPGQGRKG